VLLFVGRLRLTRTLRVTVQGFDAPFNQHFNA